MQLTGVLRAENWWGSKLPPLFALAYAEILLLGLAPGTALLLLVAVLVVTGGSTGAYGHVVNDIFDLEVDRKIGKVNRMQRFSPAVRGLICWFFVLAAFAPAFVVPYPRVTTVLVGVELLLPALYSIPPVRLKDRGALGVVADAAGAHIVPALIVVTAFAGGWPSGQTFFVVAAVLWSACLGLKGILWHQRLDREDDLRAGARTFAAAAEPSTIKAILFRFVYPVEMVAVVVMIVILSPAAPLVLGFFVLWVALDLVKMFLGWSYVYDPREPDLRRPHAPLVSNFYYELGLPLSLAVHLALRDVRFVVLILFQLGVFWPNLREQVDDLKAVVRDIQRRRTSAGDLRRFGWVLDVHEPAQAVLKERKGGSGYRIEVEASGEQSWQVKLCRPFGQVLKGASYKIRFEVRAEGSRRFTYCLVEGQGPWRSLGVSEEVEIDASWIGIVHRFIATEGDENGEVCMLMGQDRGAVELRSFKLEMEVER